MAEVELGKLALDKSNDARVREFADRMIQDHSKANRQLESIAGSKKISLPSKPGEKLQKPMKKLSGLSGKNFDHAYAEAMVKDHGKAVKSNVNGSARTMSCVSSPSKLCRSCGST